MVKGVGKNAPSEGRSSTKKGELTEAQERKQGDHRMGPDI